MAVSLSVGETSRTSADSSLFWLVYHLKRDRVFIVAMAY